MRANFGKVQQFLDAIASAIFWSPNIRDWIILKTPCQHRDAWLDTLLNEQRAVRWQNEETKLPFWGKWLVRTPQ